MELYFKISCACSAGIGRAPLDGKGPVGRRASDESEYAAARCIGAKIALISQDSRV